MSEYGERVCAEYLLLSATEAESGEPWTAKSEPKE